MYVFVTIYCVDVLIILILRSSVPPPVAKILCFDGCQAIPLIAASCLKILEDILFLLLGLLRDQTATFRSFDPEATNYSEELTPREQIYWLWKWYFPTFLPTLISKIIILESLPPEIRQLGPHAKTPVLPSWALNISTHVFYYISQISTEPSLVPHAMVLGL